MANKIYEETSVQNIATQIRAKNGTATTYKVSEMSGAISNLQCLSEATSTGANISIGASSNLTAKELDLDGRCTQDTTTGANKLQMVSYTLTDYGVDITCENNLLTLNGTQSGTPTSKRCCSLLSSYATNYPTYDNSSNYLTLPAGTYTAKFIKISGTKSETTYPQLYFVGGTTNPKTELLGLTENTSGSFTLTEETIVRVSVAFKGTLTNYKCRATLTNSGTATEELYTGGIASPNPSYPQEIKSIKTTNLVYNENLPHTTANVTGSYNNGIFGLNGTASASANLYILPYETSIVHLEAGESLTYYIERVSGTSEVAFLTYFVPDDGSSLDTTWRVTLNENASSNRVIKTTTKAGSIKYVQFFLNNGVTYNSEVKIMVHKGTTALPYLPYGSIGVNVVGKNIWDEEWELGSLNTTTGEKTVSSACIRSKNYIPLKPSTTYYFLTAYSEMCFYDANKTFISSTAKANQTFETPSNARYMLFRNQTAYGTTYNHDITIAESSTATTYEQYKNQFIAIDLAGNELCSVGNVKDGLVLDADGTKIIKKIGKVVLNGSENWQLTDDGNQYRRFGYYHNIQNVNSNANDRMNNYFITIGWEQNENTWGYYYMSSSWLVINDNNNIMSNLATFKTWLSTHNTIVYYCLATPTTITLPHTPLPHTYSSGTNVSNTEDTNMKLDYYIVR